VLDELYKKNFPDYRTEKEKMSKQNINIDDLYRSQFEKFQKDPPEHVWENIKKTLNHDPGAVKTDPAIKGGITGLTSLIVIALLVSAYLVFQAFHDNSPKRTSSMFRSLASDYSEQMNTDNQEIEPTENNEFVYSETRGIGSSSHETKSEKSAGKLPAPTKHSMTTDQKPITGQVAKSSLLAGESVTVPRDFRASTLPQLNAENISLTGNHNRDEQYPLSRSQLFSAEESSTPKTNLYKDRGNLMLGLFFTPEIIYYQEDLHLQNRGRSVDLQVLFEKNNVIFQTGLGLSKITDAGQHKIEFNKYLGSYEHVHNVVFDSVGSELVATYITETVHVYDSINYIRISPTDRRFTYLHFPVLVGYYKEINRFNWFVKTGPSLLLKMGEQIPEASAMEDQVKILNIKNSLPGKINVNWQFAISAGASYKLGNKVSLSVEPVFKYYLSSDYEKNTMSTRHPYSLGLKTGLLLDL
jgi:hypothetical protein